VALFRCEHCDLTKPVPDKYLGRKVRCPECGKDSPVIADVPEIALPASLEEEGTGAVFRCSACGHEEAADPASLGEERRCANCGGAGAVRPVRREVRVPTPEDVNLDDLAESLGEGPSAYRLEMEKERKENSARPTLLLEEGEHRPSLLQGGILGNLVSGVASGLLGMLFGAALAVLLLGAAWVDAWFGLAFGAVLLASVAGSLLMAARSGVYFGLAAPDPTGCAVLGMVVGGMAGAMPGAPAEAVAATAVAAGVSLALGMGLLAWLTWASGNGNWTRFLPVQILCGVPAALGFSVLAAAWRFLLGPEAESTSLLLVMADLPSAFASGAVWTWLPAVLLGAALLAGFRKAYHPLPLVLVLLLACALPHWLAAAGLDLPETLAPGGRSLHYAFDPSFVAGHYGADFLGRIDWAVLGRFKVDLAAGAVLLLSLSMYKLSRVENEMRREIDLARELRVLGSGNLLSGLLGGAPLSFCLGRSLGARRGGAGGPLAGLVAALVLTAGLFHAGELVELLPPYVVGGTLVFLGLALVRRWLFDVRREFFRSDDYMLLVLTFVVTLAGGVTLGTGTGLALAMIVSVTRYGAGGVIRQKLSGSNHRSHVDRAPVQLAHLKAHGGAILVVRLQGFVTVGALHGVIREVLGRMADPDAHHLSTVIVDFSSVRRLGSAMNQGFARLEALGLEHDLAMVLTSLPFEVEERLQQEGYEDEGRVGGLRIFQNLDFAMEWAEDRILEEAGLLHMEEASLPDLLRPVFPDPDQIPYLMKLLQPVKIKAGQDVFRQGDPSDSMYFIQSGWFRVELELPDGKTLRLKKMGPGAVFGEMGLYTDSVRSASVTAAESGVVYRLSKKRIALIETRLPRLKSSIDRYLVNLLAGRVADANAMARDLMR
jgi:SulP family sulfate permease